MPPKSPLWDYYTTNKSKYLTDESHLNAWCNSCLSTYISTCRQADRTAAATGGEPERTEIQLRDAGKCWQGSPAIYYLTKSTALATVSPLCGKLKKLENHLRGCNLIPPDIRNKLNALWADKENIDPMGAASGSAMTTAHNQSPLKKSKTSHSDVDGSRQAEFDVDMCKLFVSGGISWNVASNPQTQLFFEKWIPDVKVPDRRIMSGRVLNGEVDKANVKIKEKVRGKVATGQCDGWTNIARTSVVTSMMTVEHEVSHRHQNSVPINSPTQCSLTSSAPMICQAKPKQATSSLNLSLATWST